MCGPEICRNGNFGLYRNNKGVAWREITQGTVPGAHRMDSIKTWTGLPVEESVRMTENRDKWRKHVHGVANPGIEDG